MTGTHPEFEYEMDFHEDYGIVFIAQMPCPECGGETIFNAEYSEYAQFVAYDETEDGNNICGVDDSMSVTLDAVRCGHCSETLVEDEEVIF